MGRAAIGQLIRAAEALIELEQEVAQRSYQTWEGTGYLWNDQIWRASAPEQFARVERLRASIRKARDQR